jgi:hypothetical protein
MNMLNAVVKLSIQYPTLSRYDKSPILSKNKIGEHT